jgi:hypothetical protein
MIELPYSLIIEITEVTEEPDYFGFFSPDLEGFPGIGHSVEDCLFKIEWGVGEYFFHFMTVRRSHSYKDNRFATNEEPHRVFPGPSPRIPV